MRTAELRKHLPVVVVLLISVGPAVLLLAPRSSLWIVAAVVFGWLGGRIALAGLRRLSAPPAVAVAPGALSTAAGGGRREYLVPAELPPPPGLLVGRDREIDQICTYLTSMQSDERTRTVGITGAVGLGKSALAVCVAHLMADRYPDGQLLIRFDTPADPNTDEALLRFVHALKGPREPTPEPADREAWYRKRSLDKRLLIILDNVTQSTQISRLLPASRHCATIVTSREPVEGFVPALKVPLGPLSQIDGRRLLDALVGGRRIEAETTHAIRIVDACAGYPVALKTVGAVLTGRKNWTLEIAARRMQEIALPTDSRQRLVPFTGALDLAYALLTEQERVSLALLGLLQTPRVAPWMLAALYRGGAPDSNGLTDASAGRILDRLAYARFTERWVDDASGLLTFRVPAYVQAYAQVRMAMQLSPVDQDGAKREFVEEQRRRGERTPERLLRHTVYRLLDRGQLSEALDAAREALALSHELRRAVRENSAEEATVAAEEGLTLAALAEVYAELGWVEDGLASAGSANLDRNVSRQSRPRALRTLGMLQRRHRQIAEAERNLLDALRAVEDIDDPAEHIRVLRDLAAVQALSTEPKRGIATFDEARRRCDANGESGARRMPGVLWAYGTVLRACHELDDADRVFVEGDVASGDPHLGQRLWRPWIRYERALVAIEAGRYEQSRELSLCALEGFTSMRHRYGNAYCRLAVGRAYLAEGRADKATPALEEAHSTFRRCGDRWIEAETATVLARAYQRSQRGREAVNLLIAAEVAFAKLGDTRSKSRASGLLRDVESSLPSHLARRTASDERRDLSGRVSVTA